MPDISLINSPIAMFALALVVCNAVFGVCAANLKDPDSFKYCIHMFLAIISMFTLIVLWAPGLLYNPPLTIVEVNSVDKGNPVVPTVVGLGCLLLYMWYQMRNQKNTSREKRAIDGTKNSSITSFETNIKLSGNVCGQDNIKGTIAGGTDQSG